jgi:hypothetical protein
MTRLAFALIALAGLTAFAPAPFPKPDRRDGEVQVGLQSLRGRWRIVRVEEVDGQGKRRVKKSDNVPFVRIQDDLWTYLNENGTVNNRFHLAIESDRGLSRVKFLRPQTRELALFGLIRRRGDTVQILGTPVVSTPSRPTGFREIPRDWWLMTLHKER